MLSQAIFAYMSPMIFDLVTPKSNQLISITRYIDDPSFAGIHQSVLEITQSQERDIQRDGWTTQKHNASHYYLADA